MSPSISTLLRILALAFAVVQASAPALAAAADARSQAESGWVRGTHVEEHSSEDCPHVHLADCALCQFLAHGFRPAAPPRVPVTPVERIHGSATVAAHTPAADAATLRPRAPPSV
jgi:hypothetical protein